MRPTFIILFLLLFTASFGQLQVLIKEHPVKKDALNKDTAFRAILLKTLFSYHDNFKSLPAEYASKSLFDSTFNLLLKLPGAEEATIVTGKSSIVLSEVFRFKNYANDLLKLLMKINYSLPDNFVYNKEEDTPSQIFYYTYFVAPGSKSIPEGYPDKFVIMTDASSTTLTIIKDL